jgi:hypothetical protein
MWLTFALMAVLFWGLYGIFLHSGQIGMSDPVNGRYKAFFFVGLTYLLVAVLAPAGMLVAKGATWSFPMQGVTLSLIAGLVGAAGAIVALSLHPPDGGWKAIPLPFYAGILLAVIGASLVTLYKPAPGEVAYATLAAPTQARGDSANQ